MINDRFHSVKLKIERARQLRNDLAAISDVFLQRRPYNICLSYDAFACKASLYIVQREVIPDQISLLLGDIVHNLRASLDHLIFELVKGAISEAKHKSIQFPFAKGQHHFEEILNSTGAIKAGREVVTILRAMKPYPNGNHWLVALHELDILDKHRLVLPSACAAKTTAGYLGNTFGINFFNNSPADVEIRLSVGMRLNFTNVIFSGLKFQAGEVEYTPDEQPEFRLIFQENGPLSSYEMIEKVTAMIEAISELSDKIIAVAKA
jgi:hypothetical protein